MVVVYVRQTWTSKDGQHHQALAFDMFRIQDGMIAEHWDADSIWNPGSQEHESGRQERRKIRED